MRHEFQIRMITLNPLVEAIKEREAASLVQC